MFLFTNNSQAILSIPYLTMLNLFPAPQQAIKRPPNFNSKAAIEPEFMANITYFLRLYLSSTQQLFPPNQVISQTDQQPTFNSTNISTNSPTTAANSTNSTQTATTNLLSTNSYAILNIPCYCTTTSPSSERKRIALNQVNFNLMLNKFLQKLSVKSKLIVALPSKLNHKAFKKPKFLCFLNLPKTTEQIKSNSLINLLITLLFLFPTFSPLILQL